MSVRVKAVLAVVATAATFALLFVWRGFFLQHAALVALAVGALVYTTLGTTERLGRTYRRRGPRSMRPRDPD
ncbi:MAG: hypothetical protein PVG07_11930 [Acidobacteriota bacterium]